MFHSGYRRCTRRVCLNRTSAARSSAARVKGGWGWISAQSFGNFYAVKSRLSSLTVTKILRPRQAPRGWAPRASALPEMQRNEMKTSKWKLKVLAGWDSGLTEEAGDLLVTSDQCGAVYVAVASGRTPDFTGLCQNRVLRQILISESFQMFVNYIKHSYNRLDSPLYDLSEAKM